MKEISEVALPFLILASVVLLSPTLYAQPAPIVLKYDFPEPSIVKNVFVYENIRYDSVLMQSADRYGAPGKPIMPFRTVKILRKLGTATYFIVDRRRVFF